MTVGTKHSQCAKKIYREKIGHHINMVGGRKQRECAIEKKQIKRKKRQRESGNNTIFNL